MSTQFIFPDNTYNFDINYNIEGNIFNFKIYINKSSGRWYLDIRDEDLNEILSGLKIMPFQNLTKRYKSINRALFEGDIWSLPKALDKNLSVVTISNFGVDLDYNLYYLTKEESLILNNILQTVNIRD